MKKDNLKKICAALITASLVMPTAAVFANGGSNAYSVLYNLNYDNISDSTTSCWDYADGGQEGKREFTHSDGFSGSTSIKLGTNTTHGVYGTFMPHRGWTGNSCSVELENGNTYVMSFKVKKINETDSVSFSSIRQDGQWNWDYGAEFKPADKGWKAVSYTFTVGETFSSANNVLTGVPQFIYSSSNVVDDYFLLIDDFRTVQINDTSILDTAATASVSELTAEKLTVTFSQEMSDDVKNPKAYMINGKEAKSVTYDAKTKTAEVTPSEALTPGNNASVTVSACDYIGRALYTTIENEVAYPPATVCTTSIDEKEDEIDAVNSVTVSFTNSVRDLTTANLTFTPANESSTNTISSIDKVDNKTFTVNFDSFLKAGDYTLTISGVEDAYGRTVDDKSVSFKVKKVIPAVVSSNPSNGTSDIPAGSMDVSVTFNKDIDDTTTSNITADNGAEISDISVSGNVVSFTMSGLESGKSYNVTLKDIKDTDGEEVAKTTLTYYTALEMDSVYVNRFENSSAVGDLRGDLDYRRIQMEGKRTLDTDDFASGSSSMKVVMSNKYNADLTPGNGDDSNYRVKLEMGKRYRMAFSVKIPADSDVTGFTAVNGDNKTYLGSRQNLKSSKTAIEGKDGWYRYVYDFTAESQDASDITSGKANCPSLRFNLKTESATSNSIFYFDDLELYKFPEVSIVDSSVSDNDENVVVNEPIEVVFDGGVTSATATIGDIVCNTTVDGNKVTVTPKSNLGYGKYYELELNITDKNGVEATHKMQFKTEPTVKVSDVKIGGTAYTEGMNVSKDSNVSVSMKTSAVNAKDIYGVIMVYGEDGYCKKMKCEKLSIAKGSGNATITIDKSLLADGESVKLYMWNSLDKMEIIQDSMTFSLQ